MILNKTVLRKFLVLSIGGALAATICDVNHVHTGTLSYPQPFLFNQAWWVFPGFTIAFFVMALAYYTAPSILPKQVTHLFSTSFGSLYISIENLMLFMMVYLLSGFGNHESAILSIIFYSSFFIRLLFTYERSFIFIVAIVLACCGMLVEGIMTQLDMVHYRQPEIFGVPFWLGGVYMHGAFCLREGMRFFIYDDS